MIQVSGGGGGGGGRGWEGEAAGVWCHEIMVLVYHPIFCASSAQCSVFGIDFTNVLSIKVRVMISSFWTLRSLNISQFYCKLCQGKFVLKFGLIQVLLCKHT